MHPRSLVALCVRAPNRLPTLPRLLVCVALRLCADRLERQVLQLVERDCAASEPDVGVPGGGPAMAQAVEVGERHIPVRGGRRKEAAANVHAGHVCQTTTHKGVCIHFSF